MPFFCLSIISVGHFCCQLMTTVVRRPTGREALRAWETGNSQEMQIFEWKIPKKSCWSVKRQLKYCIILYPAHNIYIYIYSCFLIICWEINDVPCTSCTLWFFFSPWFLGVETGAWPQGELLRDDACGPREMTSCHRCHRCQAGRRDRKRDRRGTSGKNHW